MGADIWYINAQLYKLHNVPEIFYMMAEAQETYGNDYATASTSSKLMVIMHWENIIAELRCKKQ